MTSPGFERALTFAHPRSVVVEQVAICGNCHNRSAIYLHFFLPGFHFHAIAANDILRMKALPLGKRLHGTDADGELSLFLGPRSSRPAS
jgi:hypothetical protein